MSPRSYKPFRFKRFSVAHSMSAHKVGVDGVLLGLWTPLPEIDRNKELSRGRIVNVLDVGCGCGVISLILAQRLSDICSGMSTVNSNFRKTKNENPFLITGVDIDTPSAEEARDNFAVSEWKDNLQSLNVGFGDIGKEQSYDLIVSNPPYFNSGVENPESRRERARHQSELSPEVLVSRAYNLLEEEGILSMIIPSDQADHLIKLSSEIGYKTLRYTRVKGLSESLEKRVLLAFCKTATDLDPIIHTLVLETSPGIPTEEYKSLGKDFYLKF